MSINQVSYTTNEEYSGASTKCGPNRVPSVRKMIELRPFIIRNIKNWSTQLQPTPVILAIMVTLGYIIKQMLPPYDVTIVTIRHLCSNHIAWDLWITRAHSADRWNSRLISLCLWVTIHSSIFLRASSIQAIKWSCGWGSTVWFFPIVRITEYFLTVKAGSRTFNQSTISLTIQSTSRGILKEGLSWRRHCITNKIHWLDVDAWVNAKLQ